VRIRPCSMREVSAYFALTSCGLPHQEMIKTGFSYLKLAAVVAVLAIALVPFTPTSTANNGPSEVAAAGADISSEQRIIARYFDDFVAYDQQATEFGKRARLVSTDLDPLQQKSDGLKGRLSGVQNAVREIVKKLKAANEWENLNTTVAAGISDGTSNTFFKQTSFKQLLEETSNNLTSQRNEISEPLDKLRKRLTSRYEDGAGLQIVRAGYEASVPVGAPGSLGCTIGKLGLVAIRLSGGHPTNAALNLVFDQCWPAGSVSPF